MGVSFNMFYAGERISHMCIKFISDYALEIENYN